MTHAASATHFKLIGGALCLDLVNTIDWRDGGEHANELLNGYGDLVQWAEQAGALDAVEAAALEREAAQHPRRAAAALGHAVDLRELLRALFHAGARKEPLDAGVTAAFNASLREALSHVRVVPADASTDARATRRLQGERAPAQASSAASSARWRWTWGGSAASISDSVDSGDALERVLWPVVWSAAQLLTSSEVSLVRECAGPACGWMYVDRSRNHMRRWCSMDGCGTRAKARRYYQRKKEK